MRSVEDGEKFAIRGERHRLWFDWKIVVTKFDTRNWLPVRGTVNPHVPIGKNAVCKGHESFVRRDGHVGGDIVRHSLARLWTRNAAQYLSAAGVQHRDRFVDQIGSTLF